MSKKDNKKIKKEKSNKDWNKICLIILLVLLALEITLIPLLIYSEIKTVLPIIAFLVLPTLFGIFVLLLSRNCITDYNKKKNRLISKINADS